MSPGFDIITENAFLNSIINDNKLVGECFDVQPDQLSAGSEKVYREMMEMYSKGIQFDKIVLLNRLKKFSEKIDEICISDFNFSNFVQYKTIIKDLYIRRKVYLALDESRSLTNNNDLPVDRMVDTIESKIISASDMISNRGDIRLSDVGGEVMKWIEDVATGKREPFDAKSGLVDLDNLLGGFGNGDLIILAGRPSMGKTALALQMASGIAPVGFFSLEMPADSLFMRRLSSRSKTNLMKIRTGNLTEQNLITLSSYYEAMKDEEFFVDDTPGISILELRTKARRMKYKYGIKAIFIDYLQLLSPATSKQSREQEISEISRGLKALAKETDLPVIALSQLSRAVESRDKSRRPVLSDLRESGSLEQDADVVLFTYRPEYYGIKEFEDGEKTMNICELIVGKQRNGPVGSARTVFQKEFGVFSDLSASPISYYTTEDEVF